MIRLGTILWGLLVIAAGAAMFQVKYQVVRLESELTDLNHEIASSREATRVLYAEWSLLSDPQRLARLNDNFLHLAPVTAAQLGSVDRLAQIPLRVAGTLSRPLLAAAPAKGSIAP